MKHLLKDLNLAEVWGLDFETYYDDEYSLRKMPTTEYICDPRFEPQMLVIQRHSWSKPRVLVGTNEIADWAAHIDWSKAGVLAHHTHFDGLIASRHFGIKPAFYFDTLSMARPVMPVQVGGSLHALAQAFGLKGKVRAQALADVKGKRLADFTKAELKALALYAGDDIDQTWQLFHRLREYTPLNEMRLIDLTVKMYAQPSLVLDGPALQTLADETLRRKQELLDSVAVDRSVLMSNDKFAELLRSQGVEPPTKISKTTGKETYAFAKNDLEFKAMLEHDDEGVAALVEARLGVKSTIVETRAQRMANRAAFGPASVYLNYWGAKTGRWSGGDSANWQNLSARGPGSEIRHAIMAPKGHKLIIADLAQIEARMNAWFSGQDDMSQMFADGIDVYCAKGSQVFGRTITPDDKRERFISKVMVLMLQYGAGSARFYENLRAAGVDLTESQADTFVKGYRQTIPFITANWRATWNHVKSAFLGRQAIEHKVLVYEGFDGRGLTTLPDGTAIRYDKLEADEEGITYATKWRRLNNGEISEQRQRLYGGLCIAEGTLVATKTGWKPIESVTLDDRVFDGRDYVCHDGVVFKGSKTCATVDGILMTPDHEVLTDEGWSAALEEPRPHRPDLRRSYSGPPSGFRWKKDVLGLPMRLWERDDESRSRSNEDSEKRRNAELRVFDTRTTTETRNPQDEQTPGVRGVPLDAGPLPATLSPSLGELRRAGDQSVQTVEHFHPVLGRHGSDVQEGTDTGPHRQRQRVQPEELSLGNTKTARAEQTQQFETGRSRTVADARNLQVDASLPDSARLAGQQTACPTEQHKPVRVYDIVNAGPHHRFVVAGEAGPVVVHNCVENNIQALSRAVIAEHMLHIVDAVPNARIAMSTHDEIVAVVPNRSANKAHRTIVEVMSTPPEWAPDLPVAVKAHISERYDK